MRTMKVRGLTIIWMWRWCSQLGQFDRNKVSTCVREGTRRSKEKTHETRIHGVCKKGIDLN